MTTLNNTKQKKQVIMGAAADRLLARAGYRALGVVHILSSNYHRPQLKIVRNGSNMVRVLDLVLLPVWQTKVVIVLTINEEEDNVWSMRLSMGGKSALNYLPIVPKAFVYVPKVMCIPVMGSNKMYETFHAHISLPKCMKFQKLAPDSQFGV